MGAAHSRARRAAGSRQDERAEPPSIVPLRRARSNDNEAAAQGDARGRRRRLTLPFRRRAQTQQHDTQPETPQQHTQPQLRPGWGHGVPRGGEHIARAPAAPMPATPLGPTDAPPTSSDDDAQYGTPIPHGTPPPRRAPVLSPDLAAHSATQLGMLGPRVDAHAMGVAHDGAQRPSSASEASASEPAADAGRSAPEPAASASASEPAPPGVPHPDPLARERQDAIRLIERMLGRPPPMAARSSSPPPPPRHPRLDPALLASSLGARRPVPFQRRPTEAQPEGRPSTLGTLFAELLGASRGAAQPSDPAASSGTLVIVQGALVARTATSEESQAQGESSRAPQDVPTASTAASASHGPATPGPATPDPSAQGAPADNDPAVPHVATLEEQGDMLGRILRIAAAATAASVVGDTPMHPAAAAAATAAAAASASPSAPPPNASLDTASTPSQPRARAPSGTQPDATSPPASAAETSDRTSSEPSSSSDSANLGRDFLERLFSHRGPRVSPGNAEPSREPESMSTITRMIRDALRASLPGASTESTAHGASRRNSVAASVTTALEQARQGQPLREGGPGTFDRFLYDMVQDLSHAIQHMNASNEELEALSASDSPEDEALRTRRRGDVNCRQLSFFRLHRFEPREDSGLIPCVLVGVRSLRADEQMMGGDDPLARNPGARPGVSRFVLFVSGGRYRAQHPLLMATPREAGRDLMFMMEILGAMAAMSQKRPTASAADIARSGLVKICAADLPAACAEGRVTEATCEKCLVCLEEWQDTDECRILSCKHAFHAACVDQWLEHSSNSCPLCTYAITNLCRSQRGGVQRHVGIVGQHVLRQ